MYVFADGDMVDEFAQDFLDGVLVAPVGIVLLEFTHVAHVPDMVSAAGLIGEGVMKVVATDFTNEADGL